VPNITLKVTIRSVSYKECTFYEHEVFALLTKFKELNNMSGMYHSVLKGIKRGEGDVEFKVIWLYKF
jgi:hypothetical protein